MKLWCEGSVIKGGYPVLFLYGFCPFLAFNSNHGNIKKEEEQLGLAETVWKYLD